VNGSPPVVLTIAGSDSGGGAGIQADLKTYAALGCYGTSVITAVTAQNTRSVTAVLHVPAGMVAAQLDAVLDDFEVAAVKVGMIGDLEVAEVVANRAGRLPHLVLDPVLVSSGGTRLGGVAVVRELLAYAQVVTPNRDEAGALLGRRVGTAEEMAGAAAELAALGPEAVVITGSELAVDVLFHDGEVTVVRGPAVATPNSHGTGCTFASAIAARLASGDDVGSAVRQAKHYVAGALRAARSWRIGGGPGPLDHFGWSA
jgi:hydroxymethylpyrimidine/phosphomethylpyrimidine kinase